MLHLVLSIMMYLNYAKDINKGVKKFLTLYF